MQRRKTTLAAAGNVALAIEQRATLASAEKAVPATEETSALELTSLRYILMDLGFTGQDHSKVLACMEKRKHMLARMDTGWAHRLECRYLPHPMLLSIPRNK